MLWFRSAVIGLLLLAGCEAAAPLVDSPEPPPSGTQEEPDAGPALVPDAGPAAADAGVLLGPPYPIVLLHGMGGFEKLQNLPLDITYFNGVVADLGK
ncbi:MAG: hypothetical protein ACYC8T_37290, partial [Myxococcaceae bacterium]